MAGASGLLWAPIVGWGNSFCRCRMIEAGSVPARECAYNLHILQILLSIQFIYLPISSFCLELSVLHCYLGVSTLGRCVEQRLGSCIDVLGAVLSDVLETVSSDTSGAVSVDVSGTMSGGASGVESSDVSKVSF